MKNIKLSFYLLSILSLAVISCDDQVDDPIVECADSEFFCESTSRNFEMGFSTWPFAPTDESVEGTYAFINENADIYSEHIDSNIPWNAWMNDLTLPAEFTNEIGSRASRKIANAQLTVSVSLLNSSRDELAFDYDGSIPDYTVMNDKEIEDAYFKHLKYITDQLDPNYLIIAIEVNELLIIAPEKWEGYKLLMANIRDRIQEEYPSLQISESITLHNFYEPDVSNPAELIEEITAYANSMDLVSISFYPFFKGLTTDEDFQEAFDFLHDKIERPIAISETSHLSEDLSVPDFDLFIAGNQAEQDAYLKALLTNAHAHNYSYVIWWAHRDYTELWEIFPDEVKDLGKLWISTGIIDDDGTEKNSFSTWMQAFSK